MVANAFLIHLTESGRLEFEEFITLAAKFIVEEDAEAMQKELREAFRLYDKEGGLSDCYSFLVIARIARTKCGRRLERQRRL